MATPDDALTERAQLRERIARTLHDANTGKICPDPDDPTPYGRMAEAVLDELTAAGLLRAPGQPGEETAGRVEEPQVTGLTNRSSSEPRPHYAALSRLTDNRWGVYCTGCSDDIYVYPCKHGTDYWRAIPPVVLVDAHIHSDEADELLGDINGVYAFLTGHGYEVDAALSLRANVAATVSSLRAERDRFAAAIAEVSVGLDLRGMTMVEAVQLLRWLLAEAAWQRDVLREHVANLDPAPDRHVIELREDGWTIQHPLACRPSLFDCPVSRAAERFIHGPTAELGQFVCGLTGDGQFIVGREVSRG